MDSYLSVARTSHRRPWNEEDDNLLRNLVGRGDFIGEIALQLGRTREAVRNRANHLGLSVHSSPGRGRRRLDGNS